MASLLLLRDNRRERVCTTVLDLRDGEDGRKVRDKDSDGERGEEMKREGMQDEKGRKENKTKISWRYTRHHNTNNYLA